MVIVLYIFGFMVFIKLLLNAIRLFECKKGLNEYYSYLSKHTSNCEERKYYYIELFKNAGLQDGILPFVKPVGFGQIYTTSVSIFDNMCSTRLEVVEFITARFYNAMGVYKRRMLESINPIYWILTIINLPKNILVYIGVKPESILIKIAQIIWWILGLIMSIMAMFFQEIIRQFLSKISF